MTDDLFKDIVAKEDSIVELKGENLREGFKYKIMTGGDQIDWIDEYLETKKKNGKTVQQVNKSKLMMCKIKYNLVEVPYKKEHIKYGIGIEKEWKELSPENRLKFIKQLKDSPMDALILAINTADNPNEDKKKVN